MIDQPTPDDASQPLDSEPTGPYAALKTLNYRRFVIGWFISSICLQMMSVAILWEIYERTHDPWSLGLIGLFQALPVIAFALPGGQLADVFNRKRLLMVALCGITLCAITLSEASYYNAPVSVFYALLVCTGTAKAVGSPARAAMMPLLVAPSVFQNAVTWNSVFFHTAATVGLDRRCDTLRDGGGMAGLFDSCDGLDRFCCQPHWRAPAQTGTDRRQAEFCRHARRRVVCLSRKDDSGRAHARSHGRPVRRRDRPAADLRQGYSACRADRSRCPQGRALCRRRHHVIRTCAPAAFQARRSVDAPCRRLLWLGDDRLWSVEVVCFLARVFAGERHAGQHQRGHSPCARPAPYARCASRPRIEREHNFH
ncbi:MAG: MFS transporter [Planctomycetes bacterium]|nr:MFS transporter [Planctomycetota bacterium]